MTRVKKRLPVLLGIVCIFALTALVAISISSKYNDLSKEPNSSCSMGLTASLGSYISPANNDQTGSEIFLCTFDGKLFFVREKHGSLDSDPYSGWFCLLEDGTVQKISKLSHNSYLSVCGATDEYLYYYEYNHSFTENAIYSYSFASGEIKLLSTEEFSEVYGVISKDGSSLIALSPVKHKPLAFLKVAGDEAVTVTEDERDWSYRFGGREFFLKDESGELAGVVHCRDESGEVTALPLEWADSRSLIPAEHGLLVHAKGWSHLLYFINENGEVTELFDADCFRSRSAITVYRDTVYLSVKRFQNGGNYGAGGSESIPDDAVSGTYRISLSDYSSEKISDEIYSGLFIFDDSGIFACDEDGRVYWLDFDGNVIGTLLEEKK